MKRKIFIIIFLTLIPFSVSAEDTIRLTSGEWPPYQSKNLKYAGFASRIVTEAFAFSEIKAEFGYFPWKRSYKYAKDGVWDGTFLWFDTPERRKSFYISDPIVDIQYVLFHIKSYPFNWHSIDDLKGIKIGGTLGYDYGDLFQNAEKEKKIEVERIAEDKQNFKKLLKGRHQLFPCELETGYEIIQKHFTKEEIKLFTHHPKPLKANPHHLLLSKEIPKNEKRMKIFNAGLKRLKESGKIKKYIAKSRRGDYKLK